MAREDLFRESRARARHSDDEDRLVAADCVLREAADEIGLEGLQDFVHQARVRLAVEAPFAPADGIACCRMRKSSIVSTAVVVIARQREMQLRAIRRAGRRLVEQRLGGLHVTLVHLGFPERQQLGECHRLSRPDAQDRQVLELRLLEAAGGLQRTGQRQARLAQVRRVSHRLAREAQTSLCVSDREAVVRCPGVCEAREGLHPDQTLEIGLGPVELLEPGECSGDVAQRVDVRRIEIERTREKTDRLVRGAQLHLHDAEIVQQIC